MNKRPKMLWLPIPGNAGGDIQLPCGIGPDKFKTLKFGLERLLDIYEETIVRGVSEENADATDAAEVKP